MRNVTLSIPPNATDLTSLSRVKEELGITATSDDVLLSRLISDATNLVHEILGRELYRAQWVETFAGNSKREILLSQYPVASLDAVTYYGAAQTLTDFKISSRNTGSIYNSVGFGTGGDPTEWGVTYTAGYFLVGDNLSGTTFSAVAADPSINDSASGLPTLLRSGDVVRVAGFTGDTTNNGIKTVTGTPTAAKFDVDQALVNDAAGESVTLTFESAGAAVFERVATALIASAYRERKKDKGLKSLKVGDVTFTWDSDLRARAKSALGAFQDLS